MPNTFPTFGERMPRNKCHLSKGTALTLQGHQYENQDQFSTVYKMQAFPQHK